MLLTEEGLLYTFGANNHGQLGINKLVTIKQKSAVHPVSLINDCNDKVKLIACGPNYSLAYTESGTLYYFGYLVPDDPTSVQHAPVPM